jgi:hypothetical protein
MNHKTAIMKTFYLIFVFLAFTAAMYAQNVGINTTGATPNPTAGLDIDFTNKGLLIPRVNLTSLTSYNPPITGGSATNTMLVYNTNNTIGEGFYYWNGSSWVKFLVNSSNSDAWLRTGNAGTNPANNFIGTTDNQALGFRTNNTERMRIASNGNVGIGTTAPNSPLTVVGNSLFGVNNAASVGAVQITTGGASPISNRLTYGTDGTGWKFAIGKNQGGTVTDQLTIQDNGDVGIGTTSPSDRLQVANGNVRVGEINPQNTGTFPNYGRFLYFSGGPAGGTLNSENSDLLWIARYNSASVASELRVNISDENYTNDAFVVGYTASPTNIWYPILGSGMTDASASGQITPEVNLSCL